MYRDQRISLVMPCLDEERGLREIFRDLPPLIDEVIVVDNNSTDGTGAVARSFGATVFETNNGREAEEIIRATGGRGVDVAFEAAGDPEAVEAVIAAVKPGGQVVLIGIPIEDRTAFTASTSRRKDLTIKVVHRMKHTYPRTIQLVQSGRVDVHSLVTHHFPLEEVVAAYSCAEKREGIKVVVDC